MEQRIDHMKYLEGMEEYDIILKSPGIPFRNIDISKLENKTKVNTEDFLKAIDERLKVML